LSKYAWNFAVSPVPSSGHMYIDLPEQELQELRTACDDEVERRVQEAVKDNERRLRKQLEQISEKCAGGDADGKRWHDTFISNPLELCRMLKHLNVTNDPKLEEARKKLEEIMEGKTKEMFKDKPEVREEVKKEVDEIIKTYEW
jgi:F0F1-type ATP synthase membrane subunit b/b'